jgi:hypothetical protein
MQLDPLYQTSLTKADVEYLMRLPPRICLALPFLKHAAHIEAHRLLRKYTAGDGEAYFNAIDQGYVPYIGMYIYLCRVDDRGVRSWLRQSECVHGGSILSM